MNDPSLKRTITKTSAILLVVSAIVGSGIFKKVTPMAQALHSPVLILTCWALAGALSLMGALSNAELASMMPGSGGEYIYFKKIYGRFFSFLYAWGNLVVMKSATIAALAYVFAESSHELFPGISNFLGGSRSVQILASLLIIGLSYINHRGVALGEKVSRYLIAGIVLSILAFVILAATSGKGNINHFSQTNLNAPSGWALFSAMFAASLSAFWGYEGWNNIGFIGEEVKNPKRNIPIALGVGTLVVITLYLLVNTVYLYIIPIGQLEDFRPNQIAAVETARVLSGNFGVILLSLLIFLTTFNCTNGTILLSARIFYAMARDGLFLKKAGQIHPVYETPSYAIRIQAIWSVVLVWSGSFDALTDLLVFASFIFYGAAAFGVIVLRKKEPEAPRPYRVATIVPILFSVFCFVLVVVSIVNQPLQAAIGLLLIGGGVPVYLYYRRLGGDKVSR